MNLRTRVAKLRQAVGNRPPPGQLSMVVAMPVGGGMADGRPPWVYYSIDGKVATVIFDGVEVDPAVLAPLDARLAPWGMMITADAGEITPPPLPPS